MREINWSEKYNALSPEIRLINSAILTQQRIQHLNFEKSRLKKRYAQSIKEINDHIKNCEQHLVRLNRDLLTNANPQA